MKKLFLFATVAAAGLFASCSSTDDAISEGGNPAIENVDGDKQAIKIGLGNMVNIDATRGTGTVGGVGNGANNWYGQSINVFMFNKIDANSPTLTLAVETPGATPVYYYDNREMITPGSIENKIDEMSTPDDEGEAMNKDGSVKYYPTYGNFDFFGYHIDGALTSTDITKNGTDPEYYTPGEIATHNAGLTGAVAAGAAVPADYQTKVGEAAAGETLTADEAAAYNATLEGAWSAQTVKTPGTSTLWTIPFTIDGSQDLMTTKAELTGTLDISGQNPSGTGQKWAMYQATGHQNDYYSAYSARKQVQPTLTFSHLLSRLQFTVKAGSASAAGFGKGFNITAVAATNASIDAETYNALSVTDKALFEEVTPATDPATYKFKVAPTVESFKNYSAAVQALCTPTTSDGQDEARAVRVKSISVESKAKGSMAVAWIGDKAEHEKITWDATNNNPVEMFLKERPDYKLNPGATITYEDVKSTKAEYEGLTSSTEDQIAELNTKAQGIAKEYISAATYALLVDDADKGKNKYTALSANEKYNAQLVTLTPQPVTGTTPNYETDAITGTAEQIGEALIIAPNTTEDGTTYTGAPLTMHITVAQMVPTDWRNPYQLAEKEQTYELTIPVPKVNSQNDAFRINHSYNVNLTVYSLERIQVLTTISEWENGGNRQVGGDDDPDWTEHPDMENDPE